MDMRNTKLVLLQELDNFVTPTKIVKHFLEHQLHKSDFNFSRVNVIVKFCEKENSMNIFNNIYIIQIVNRVYKSII